MEVFTLCDCDITNSYAVHYKRILTLNQKKSHSVNEP